MIGPNGVSTQASARAKRKYRIVPKRDFGGGNGFWMEGQWVKSGFVVTDGLCNVMPGAAWFRSIRSALVGIDCLEKSAGNSDEFWRLVRANKDKF